MTGPVLVRALALSALLSIVLAATSQAQTFGGGARQQLRSACQGDVRKLCGDTQAGGGRLLSCLRAKQDQVSSGCKSALSAARQR